MASVSKLNGRSANVAGSSFITSTKTSSAAVAQAGREQRRVHARQRPAAASAQRARRVVHAAA